ADGVKRLSHHNPPPYGARDLAVGVFSNELRPFRVGPSDVNAYAKQEDVGPIDEERRAEGEEVGKQPRRERQHGDDAKKNEVQPGQVAVRAPELVKLGLLSDPENAEGHQAEEP